MTENKYHNSSSHNRTPVHASKLKRTNKGAFDAHDRAEIEQKNDEDASISRKPSGRMNFDRNKNASFQAHRDLNYRKKSNFSQNKVPTFAAIDLGTNNCRLLIVRRNPSVERFGIVPHLRPQQPTRINVSGRKITERIKTHPPFYVVDSYSKVVRLGTGLTQHGRLSQESMDRTIEALQTCAERLERREVTHVRAVATQACRAADNCDEFLMQIKQKTGLTLDLIDTQTEARLGYSSCASLLSPRIPYAIIFDIGGGSTELSWLKISAGLKPKRLGTISIPWGVVTLCEGLDPQGQGFSKQKYQEAKESIAQPLRAFVEQHRIKDLLVKQQVQIMGTSGTVTTLSAIAQNLPKYMRSKVDGSYLTYKKIRQVCHELFTMSQETRAQLQSIGNNRSDLVVPGCAILEALCDEIPAERLRIADRGLREGMLYELMEQEIQERRQRQKGYYSEKAKGA